MKADKLHRLKDRPDSDWEKTLRVVEQTPGNARIPRTTRILIDLEKKPEAQK